jgi:hypothetical protein
MPFFSIVRDGGKGKREMDELKHFETHLTIWRNKLVRSNKKNSDVSGFVPAYLKHDLGFVVIS